MTTKILTAWAWIAVALPLFLGFMFLLNPGAAIPAGTTVADMAKFVGMKNIVYSLLLGYALLKKSPHLILVLLVGRGISDVSDGLTGIASGYLVPPYFGALITGVISLIASYVLSKQKPMVEVTK